MNNTLTKILTNKKQSLVKHKQMLGENKLLEQIQFLPRAKSLKKILEYKISIEEVALISEIKKAAPGKGIFRKSFNPLRIAKTYEQAGSVAISVVTEETVYLGKNEYLKEIRANTNLPLIRKDYLFDPYQILESRFLGADVVMLKMSILSIDDAKELESIAEELGMEVIIEIHDEEGLKKASELNSKLISINNRNLKTLEVDLDTVKSIAKILDKNYILICENGIQSIENIREINNYNVYCFLVGEYILNKPNIKNAIQVLLK
jgi:indole-3-glycerol phosphate synthase